MKQASNCVKLKEIKSTLTWIVAMFIITASYLFLNSHVCALSNVCGDSMYPTLKNGEYLLVDRIHKVPTQGDVIVASISLQGSEERCIVKRVIAVGGETVTIDYESNEVMVNEASLWEPYVNPEVSDPMRGRNDTAVIEYTVPDGYVFVMGDNRNHSTDSRDKEVGCISMDSIIGKVIYPCVGMKKDAGNQ